MEETQVSREDSWFGSAAADAIERIRELNESESQELENKKEDHIKQTDNKEGTALEEDKDTSPQNEYEDEAEEDVEKEQNDNKWNVAQGSSAMETMERVVVNFDGSESDTVELEKDSESELDEQQVLDPDRKTLLQGDARNSKSEKEISEEQKKQDDAQKLQYRQEERVNAANQASAPMPNVPGANMAAGVASALGGAVGRTGGALFAGLSWGYRSGLGVASKKLENLDGFRLQREKSGESAGLGSCREGLRNSIDAAIDDARKEVSSERMGEHVNAITGNLEEFSSKIQQRAKEIESEQGPNAAKEFMDEQKKGLEQDRKVLGDELKEYPEHSAKLQEFFAAILDKCKKFINTVLGKIGLRNAPVENEASEQEMGPSPR